MQENKKNIKEENFDQILKLAEEKSFQELETILQEIKAPSQLPRPKKIELSVAILEKMKRLKKYYGKEMSEVEMIEALLDKELKQQETDVKNRTSTDHTKATRYIPKATPALLSLKRPIFNAKLSLKMGFVALSAATFSLNTSILSGKVAIGTSLILNFFVWPIMPVANTKALDQKKGGAGQLPKITYQLCRPEAQKE